MTAEKYLPRLCPGLFHEAKEKAILWGTVWRGEVLLRRLAAFGAVAPIAAMTVITAGASPIVMTLA